MPIRCNLADVPQSQGLRGWERGWTLGQGLRRESGLRAGADSTPDALEATVLDLSALERESTPDVAGAEAPVRGLTWP